jgi:hypothetical protein
MMAGPIGKAALAYWGMIFVLGFVLGTVRVLVLEPALGPLAATLFELPVMLLASWFAANWLVRRFAISGTIPALAMGAIAFALLMASELALAALLPGNSPSQWLARMATLPAALGLAGQVGFALMPWLVTVGPTAR